MNFPCYMFHADFGGQRFEDLESFCQEAGDGWFDNPADAAEYPVLKAKQEAIDEEERLKNVSPPSVFDGLPQVSVTTPGAGQTGETVVVEAATDEPMVMMPVTIEGHAGTVDMLLPLSVTIDPAIQ